MPPKHVIAHQTPAVITSYAAAWVCGAGTKSPQDAASYIKTGKNLSPLYYPQFVGKTEQQIRASFDKQLFMSHPDDTLTKILGEPVYVPWDCLSARHMISIIDDKIGLIARPQGVTANYQTILHVDKFRDPRYPVCTEYAEAVAQLSMAVWKTPNAATFFTRYGGTLVHHTFDHDVVNDMLDKIIEWADTIELPAPDTQ